MAPIMTLQLVASAKKGFERADIIVTACRLLMIHVTDVHKAFGTNQVLRGVNLDIPTGPLFVIVGGSGSGKSVLLKHLIALLRPDWGEVWIDEAQISHLSVPALAQVRKRFGMLFQGEVSELRIL
jgi:ABC-type transporter Mla maintaining outer membrane lipid asymmetry ATPase subunit MlaF